MNKWSRRAFIGAGTITGGGFLLGVAGFTLAPGRHTLVAADAGDHGQLTTWITVTPDDIVTVLIPHCEMGQGTPTALAMMAAEEMDADWSLVRVKEAPALDEYANGYIIRTVGGDYVPAVMARGVDYGAFKLAQWFGFQVTGGSTAVRSTGEYGMRIAGAAAKEMLLTAGGRAVRRQRRRVQRERRPCAARCVGKERVVRRTGACRRGTAGSHQPHAEEPGRLHAAPHVGAAPRHPVEGRRQRRLRHRRQRARHAVRGGRVRAGTRRTLSSTSTRNRPK